MQGLIYKDELLRTLKADPLYDVVADKYNIEGVIESMPEVGECVDFKDYREMRRMYETWRDVAKGYEKIILGLSQAIGKG